MVNTTSENGQVMPGINILPVIYPVKSVCVNKMYFAISYLLKKKTIFGPTNNRKIDNPMARELERKTLPIINAKLYRRLLLRIASHIRRKPVPNKILLLLLHYESLELHRHLIKEQITSNYRCDK